MKVGFTGTRHGLTPAQGGALARTVRDTEGMTEFHQGCCVGADTEATGHVRHHLPGVVVHGRPGALPLHGAVWENEHDGNALLPGAPGG
jgi:hypothetical protein